MEKTLEIEMKESTLGWNCRLYEDGEKVAQCKGCGYDMRGTVLGDWLEKKYQDRIVGLDPSCKFYGLYANKNGLVSVDGGTGFQSMESLGEAIGVSLKSVRTRSGDIYLANDDIAANAHLIAKHGNLPLLQKALEDGALDVDARFGRYGETMLMVAADQGRTNVVSYLIQAGANPDLANERGDTALMAAARFNQMGACAELAKVSDLSKADVQGRTAADMAYDPQLREMLKAAQEAQRAKSAPAPEPAIERAASKAAQRGLG